MNTQQQNLMDAATAINNKRDAKHKAIRDWAISVAQHDSTGDLRAQDIVHDVYGLMRDDDHFIPRL